MGGAAQVLSEGRVLGPGLMIFVTVGTHEQQMDRLVLKVDGLVQKGSIQEDVFIQRGTGTQIPRNCDSAEMLPYSRMVRYTSAARIIITHGGPGSIMLPLLSGKHPIVVPRQSRYGEHIDDHQVAFAKRMEAQHRIIAVYDIDELEAKIAHFEAISKKLAYSTDRNGVSQLVNNLERYCNEIRR